MVGREVADCLCRCGRGLGVYSIPERNEITIFGGNAASQMPHRLKRGVLTCDGQQGPKCAPAEVTVDDPVVSLREPQQQAFGSGAFVFGLYSAAVKTGAAQNPARRAGLS